MDANAPRWPTNFPATLSQLGSPSVVASAKLSEKSGPVAGPRVIVTVPERPSDTLPAASLA